VYVVEDYKESAGKEKYREVLALIPAIEAAARKFNVSGIRKEQKKI
jgi:hypothetical protein